MLGWVEFAQFQAADLANHEVGMEGTWSKYMLFKFGTFENYLGKVHTCGFFAHPKKQ